MNGKAGNSTENGTEDYLMGYQKIYEHIPDGVTIFDMNGSLLWCNKAALDIYGYSDQEEVLGTTYSEYIHPENRMEEMDTFQRVKRGEINLLLDSTFTAFRKDGTQFPAHVRTTPIIVEDKFVGFQSHSRDISKIVATEYKLRASLSDMEILTDLVQHDFRNDLQIVENAIEASLMLMDGSTRPTEFLSMAKSGLHRMRSLLMLTVPNNTEEVETLEDLINQRIIHSTKMHPDFSIIFKESQLTNSVMISNRRLLAFVLDNLFRNSVKYAGPSSTIIINVEHQDNTLQIDIADDGPGIPEDMKTVLFHRGTTTSGSGLGLHICKRILKSYGGNIELLDSSEDDVGAAFRITLSIVPSDME
ncbi:MAG: ATP-binding protein [Candidatus Thorarchaeota archaeon]